MLGQQLRQRLPVAELDAGGRVGGGIELRLHAGGVFDALMTRPVLTVVAGSSAPDSRAALRELYEKFGGSVYGRCLYLLKDRAKAEDAMQDVFARALTAYGDFRAESSPLTW